MPADHDAWLAEPYAEAEDDGPYLKFVAELRGSDPTYALLCDCRDVVIDGGEPAHKQLVERLNAHIEQMEREKADDWHGI